MDTKADRGRTILERGSDRELVVTRTFDAPIRRVYEAWTKPDLFKLWWAPQSSGVPMQSCDMDVRTGGSYRIAFGDNASNARIFFGTYLEVLPPSRLVWTNDESANASITTVTFATCEGRTSLVLRDLYPKKEALDEAFDGMKDAMPEQFNQLDELLRARSADE